MTIQEAVQAAKGVLYYANPNDVETALTAALPFLTGVKVDVTDIGNPIAGLKDKLIKDADWLSEYGHQLHEECEYHDGGHTANRLQAIGERITKLFEKTELPEDKTVKRRIADALEYVWSGLDCDVDHIDSIISHMHGNGLRIVETVDPAPSPRAQAFEEAALERSIERWRGMKPSEVMKGSTAQITYALEDARKDILTLYSALSSQPVADGLPQDVINLVIAAREFWEDHYSDLPSSHALDEALEAFSDRVLYENEPNALPSSPGA